MKPLAYLKQLVTPHKKPDDLETLLPKNGQDQENGAEELILVKNIVNLRDKPVSDVMVPRANIIGVDITTSLTELLDVFKTEAHSRMPVYQDTLDDVIGVVLVKDLLQWWGKNNPESFELKNILRKTIFISPSMRILDLLLEMRQSRVHMAIIVDEYGGVDGLVTIEDLMEEIVGDIEDEHDEDTQPTLSLILPGIYVVDARVMIEQFEETIGVFASEEERQTNDTLGGLVYTLAGHIPTRGEIVKHPSGLEFEIVDADPRKIHLMKVRLMNFKAQTTQ